MRKLILLPILLIGGCSYADGIFGSSGTTARFEGTVCGETISIGLVDKKDRSEASFIVHCPGGGDLTFASTDSSTSAVVNALAQLTATLGDIVTKLATAPVAPATLSTHEQGVALERLAYTIEAERL